MLLPLLDGAARAAEKEMNSFSPQNAANTIWCVAQATIFFVLHG